MFSNNSYVKIKDVQEKEKITLCKITSSRKKQDGTYTTDFVATARFVGKAHLQRPMKDQRIKITSCGVENCKSSENGLEFLKMPNYTVFDYELQEDGGAVRKAPALDVLANDTELPF